MKGSRPLEIQEIRKVKKAFKGPFKHRNYAFFILGTNTGFRISEILTLRLGDILEENGDIKKRLTVYKRNMKGKRSSRTILLNQAAREAITPWLKQLAKLDVIHKDDYIFRSIRGNQPIDRTQAWRILNETFQAAGLIGKLGTHSMRKTFANNIYKYFLKKVAQGEPIDAFRSTSKALGHTDIKSTDQYLSFLEEDVDEAIEKVGIL